jgi:phospholipid/cholesterol/gamma-HCH transport system permease protein
VKSRDKRFVIPGGLQQFFIGAGQLGKFTGRFFSEGLKPPYEFREVGKQAFEIGYKSLPLIGVTSFILGFVVILQSRPSMMQFGAGSYLPAMSAISIVREIGPLVTALVCAGKIGSGISAELGSMKVTEQIDAMEVSGTNPFKFLVATRIAATTLMIPVLTVYADAIAMTGSFVGANTKGSINIRLFVNEVFTALSFNAEMPALIKSFLFGFAIGLVGCTKGYHSQNGTQGVGQAANSAVVVSMLAVILFDMLVTQITAMLGYL